MSDHRHVDPAMTLFTALHQAGWQDFFDPASLERGLRYARQGRVASDLSLAFEHDQDLILLLSGEVAGSRKQAYFTEVEVYAHDSRGLFSDCSCPVGSGCKHAVALIQTFLDQLNKETKVVADNRVERDSPRAAHAPADTRGTLTREWETWLEWLQNPPGTAPGAECVGTQYRLGLFLDTANHYASGAILKVLPVWLRPSRQSKRGNGWVSPKVIEVRGSGELIPVPEAGWNPEQEEAIDRLLHGEVGTHWSSDHRQWAVMSHAFQVRGLWSLLESDEPPLLFFRKQTGKQLEFGADGWLAPSWQPDAEGVQHLQATTQPEGLLSAEALIARAGRGLCYIDPARGRFGRLGGDPELLVGLRRAPPLPPAMSEWLGERLRKTPALAARLPAPKRVEEHTLADVAPRLKVTMRVVEGQLGFRDGVAVARWFRVGAGVVGFDYDGMEVAPEEGETAQLFHAGQRVTIKRNKAAELALVRSLPPGMVALERLSQAHQPPAFLDLPAWSLLLPVAGELPSRAAEWPTHLAKPDDWWPMIAELRQAGCRVEFSDEFPPEPRYIEPDAWHGELEPAGNGWFDLALDIEVGGERLNLLPILRQLLMDPTFPLEVAPDEPEEASWELVLDEQRRLALPLSRLRALMAPILDWLNDETDPRAALKLPVSAAERVAPLAEHERWAGRDGVASLARQLKTLPASLPAPPGFAGELRDYQSRGLAWMRFLAVLGTGGILADDMGLGKTVQVLAHVLDERARGALQGPVLVVAPTSLVGNWCAEAARFAPQLAVLALQGGKAQRQRQIDEKLATADLVVTTYPLLIRDLDRLCEVAFGLLVLDEAQAIKNAASQTAQAVRGVNAGRALAMTGTPLENHLGELWAQLDAVAPGALGSQQWFGRHFRTPIEKDSDVALRGRLARRIAPLMLRRTKQQVLTELPEKTESRREITLAGSQRELYESLRLAQHQRVQQAIAERGLAGSGIVMLDALLKLRQVCCDPRLVKLDSASKVKRSAKLEQLREILPSLVEEGRRILVFSQFTEMLGLIGQALERDGISYTTLTGDTPGKTRTQRVALFQQGEIPVFLISLKAGGTGLNLTAADTVIHYDPWWNPAVEAQATGRAHRLGQQNPVFVYKLVCAGTVEERILGLQARKADLAASILEGGTERKSDGPLFDEEDLALLFAPVA